MIEHKITTELKGIDLFNDTAISATEFNGEAFWNK